MIGVGITTFAIAGGLFFLYGNFEKGNETYSGPEFALRKLTATELAAFSSKGLSGDCIAAYKVGRHHMFYTFDEAQAVRFFRIASKCPNANAHASLISLLVGKSESDAEVDESLLALGKLDPKMAEAASVEIALRRKQRSGVSAGETTRTEQ